MGREQNMKKRVCCILGMIWMLCMLVTVSSVNVNAATKSESINASVKNFMKQAQKLRIKGIRSRIVDLGDYDVVYDSSNQSSEMYNYYKKCAKKMTYKVVSKKKKNKNTYEVKLRITYVNSYQFTENLVTEITNDMLSGKIDLDKLMEMSDKEILQYTNSLIRTADQSAKTTKYRKQTIKLKFIKKGNKWKVKKMTKALDNVLEANVPASFEKLSSGLY
jgi:hypothetical protein